eukprot:NODE_157_length_16664_cov_0.301781.p8 type:complete len:201 gc:universal NODE_157_length_16664_cov_0.301781:4153-3551(-)
MKRPREENSMDFSSSYSPRKRTHQCPPMLREFLIHLPKELLVDLILVDRSIDEIDIPIELDAVISFLDSLQNKVRKLLPDNDTTLYAYDRVKSVLYSIKEAVMYFTPLIMSWDYFVYTSQFLLNLPEFEHPANHTKMYLIHYLSVETKSFLEQTRVMPLFASQYQSILNQRARDNPAFVKLLEVFNLQYSWMLAEVPVHS